MRIPQLVKPEEIEIVSPEGQVRCRVSAAVTGTTIFIEDPQADVRTGDEIRRRLPNGRQEAFKVEDPTFYSSGPFGAHYQVKVSRPKIYDMHTGGNYAVNVSGNNARVNIHSNDHSTNVVTGDDLFDRLRSKVEANISDSAEKDALLDAVESLRATQHDKASFMSKYQALIALAANHMTIIAPFLPALGELVAKLHS